MSQDIQRYHRAVILLHWLTFVLIVLSYASIEGRELFERGTQLRDSAKYIHFVVGLSILLATVARIIFRLTSQAPALPNQVPAWMNKAAKLGHLLIYLFLIVMPVLGWMIISAEGKTVEILGMSLPSLVAPDHDFAELLEETHELIGKFGYALLSGHILMAIYHQHVVKDNLLERIK